MTTRAIITLPARINRQEAFEVKTLVSHPMETGHRVDSEGRRIPRNALTRLECRLNGSLAFAAQLHPAVAANPYVSFWLKTDAGTPAASKLAVTWLGERGFAHTETVSLNLT
jgi:sulfur-oxidizing protein SoxZ